MVSVQAVSVMAPTLTLLIRSGIGRDQCEGSYYPFLHRPEEARPRRPRPLFCFMFFFQGTSIAVVSVSHCFDIRMLAIWVVG